MNTVLSRRALLATLGAGAVAGLAVRPRIGHADPAGVRARLDEILGGASLQDGKVEIDLPEVADNGATVPMTVRVDSPMTADNYVKAVHVLADGNPFPTVAAFNFSPRCGKAEAGLRIRLAKTQTVHAVAIMSDGSAHGARRQVKVTVGGC